MFKDLRCLFKYNLKKIILFELVFKIISLLIFSPLFLELFNLIMKLTGFTYLTLENIGSFLANPLTIILLFLLILIITFYKIFDISTIILFIDASKNKVEVSIKNVTTLAFKKSLRIFKPKNILISFLVLFLIPF